MVRRSPLPWLHIAEEVASEAVVRDFKRLAITGTRWLVDSEVYPDALTARGLDYMRPTPEEREEINRIIMDELVCSDEGRWLRRRGARLHRDPADHERHHLAAANARFDATARPRGAAASRGGVMDD